MGTLEILTFPNEFLLRPVKAVESIDDEIHKIVETMAETMYAAPGVGLAAIQVGYDKRILIYDISQPEAPRSLQVLINPRIVSSEGEVVSENEGCLSVPDFRADVKRATAVQVEAFDRQGKQVSFRAEGFPAIVLQHEIDHLNGTLFIDRISGLKRELYKRRVLKQLKRK